LMRDEPIASLSFIVIREPVEIGDAVDRWTRDAQEA
jgi:hypothetical protein